VWISPCNLDRSHSGLPYLRLRIFTTRDFCQRSSVTALYGHFGPRTLRPQDTSAPIFGAEVSRTLRHRCRSVPDTSAPVPKCLQALVPKCLKTLREGATCRLPGDTSRMLMELQSWNFTVIMIQASTRGDPWMETFHKFMSEFCVSPTIHVSWPNLSKIGRCEVAEKSSGIAYKKRRVRDTF